MKILICPFSKEFLNNKIFSIDKFDKRLKPHLDMKRALEREGVTVNTIDRGDILKADFIVFFGLGLIDWVERCINKIASEKMILILRESPMLRPKDYDKDILSLFSQVGTWSPELVDNRNFFYFPVYVTKYCQKKKIKFNNKKYLTTVCANKKASTSIYPERIKAIKYFSKNAEGEFDFFGRGWNKKSLTSAQVYASYKGSIKDKQEVLEKYKYSICYENAKFAGYVTEKIFDSLQARCVPIYLGAPDITKYVPPEIFIDKRNFSTYEELDEYLRSIDEKEYNNYIHKINKYLESKQFESFLSKNYVANMKQFISRKKFEKIDIGNSCKGKNKIEALANWRKSKIAISDKNLYGFILFLLKYLKYSILSLR